MATSNPLVSDASMAFVNQLFSDTRPVLVMDALLATKRAIHPNLEESTFIRKPPPSYSEAMVDDSYRVIHTLQLGRETMYQIENLNTQETSYISVQLFEQLFKSVDHDHS